MDSNLVTIITGKGRGQATGRGAKQRFTAEKRTHKQPSESLANDPTTSHRFDLQLKIQIIFQFSRDFVEGLHVNYLVSFFNMQFWVIVGQFQWDTQSSQLTPTTKAKDAIEQQIKMSNLDFTTAISQKSVMIPTFIKDWQQARKTDPEMLYYFHSVLK